MIPSICVQHPWTAQDVSLSFHSRPHFASSTGNYRERSIQVFISTSHTLKQFKIPSLIDAWTDVSISIAICIHLFDCLHVRSSLHFAYFTPFYNKAFVCVFPSHRNIITNNNTGKATAQFVTDYTSHSHSLSFSTFSLLNENNLLQQ